MSLNNFKVKKDRKIREKMKQNEIKLLTYKYLSFSTKNLNHKQFYNFIFIKKFHLNSSSSRIVNRCVITGKARWVLSRFKLSRIKFKEMCENGNIHGVRRSSY